MKILSDTYAKTDLIGQKIYSEGIVNVIKSIDTNGSFTIGVYGEWGSGKTSLLRQIQKSIENNQTSDNKIITIWFNPWQFVSDEHLIIPFFHTIISTLESKKEESKFKDIKNNIEKFIQKVANIPTAILYGTELEFKIPFLVNSKFITSKMIDYQEKEEKRIDVDYNSSTIKEMSKKYDSVYYNLINILKEAISFLNHKIVIFIDDLDRTLPEKAIQLLEGLKVLFDLPSVIFVIGADKQIIQSGIRLRYKNVYDNEEMLESIENKYLHKIIQFPFTLPTANSEKLKENILKKNLSHIPDAIKYVDLIYNTLGNNPRDLKRFINSISFYDFIAKKRFSDDYKPVLLIKISLIQYLYDKLFRQLEKSPNDLIRLEKFVKDISIKLTNRISDYQTLIPFIKPTGITKIDKWLGEKTFSQLFSILSFSDLNEINFDNIENAQKYIMLTAPSKSNVSIKTYENTPLIEIPLIEEIKNRMVLIPYGITKNEKEEQPISSFYIDKYPITQSIYKKIMNTNPSNFLGDDKPVENVSWIQAVDFCNKLSEKVGLEAVYNIIDNDNIKINLKKNGFRLPTEKEWMYSCGKIDVKNISKFAWYFNNSEKQTHEVGLLKPNKYGLYDIIGNVWEWCNDNYSKNINKKLFMEKDNYFRVIRGGSWITPISRFKNNVRDKEATITNKNYIGFRICIQNINI